MTREELLTLPKYQLVRGLFDGTVPFHDLLRAFDIHASLSDLGTDVLAFVYRSRRNNYHIVVNVWLDTADQVKVFFHELKHILEDLPVLPHILGLDMSHCVTEQDADSFFYEVSVALGPGGPDHDGHSGAESGG